MKSENTLGFYKDYITEFSTDIDMVVRLIEWTSRKEGILAMEDYGLMILQGTYRDFWKWLYEEKEIQNDRLLTQIACYVQDEMVMKNKKKLLETFEKYDPLTAAELNRPLLFYTNVPIVSYSQRYRVVAGNIEIIRYKHFMELQKYNHSFTKFSIETESAAIFRVSSEKRRQRYLRDIANCNLKKAFILYYPSHRDLILECMSLRLRNLLLEDMIDYVRQDDFCLDDCVCSEHKITDIIRKINKSVK